MATKKPAIAMVILIIAIIILSIKLLAPRPIQIILGEDQAIPLEGAIYFTLTDAILMVISAWIGGMVAFYLLLRESIDGVPTNKSVELSPLVLKL